MFAVVEFLKSGAFQLNEVAVVPLLWVRKNDTKCYWPKNIGKLTLSEFIKKQPAYKKSWPLYKLHKIHFKTGIRLVKYEKYLYILIVFRVI